MANTYTQLYVQVVFAVKDRQSLIPHRHKEELHRYITGIVQRRGAKFLAVHCMPDHTHLFVSYSPALAIADLVKEVKTATSTFIKDKRWTRVPFYWQEGYGAFPTLNHKSMPSFDIS
uniref:IS200/IS605 family transposase n=1 Tax=Larkinella arboricola TaxID=643671 RepID=UPI00286E9F14|nr:IS200/IS605 family transposase [Larkinella arboricola]